MSSTYYLTFKSLFEPEKPKKLDKTSFNVKFFDWDYLHLTAQTKETYFNDKTKLLRMYNLVLGC